MANTDGKGPFRADHVGSLIRPDHLLDARVRRDRGELDDDALRALEDDGIRDVIAMQESVGLSGITDGEFRRGSWNTDFLTGFDNVKETRGRLEIFFKNADGTLTTNTPTGWVIEGKLKRSHGIQISSFDFLKSATTRVAKVCIPSPSLMHFRGGRKAIDRDAYPDLAEFWSDLATAYNQEIQDLVSHGLTYLQLDDVNLAYLCDENFRAAVAKIGEDPDALPALYCRVINQSIRNLPDHVTICVHLCRGNASRGGVASGGYEKVADHLLNALDVDGYFLEFDDERSGDFSPLRFLPETKKVVLGLVTTKHPELESSDGIKRRIDEAARFVPLEQLCLSPQCGFSSGAGVRPLSRDNQVAKLERVVQVADEVWGSG